MSRDKRGPFPGVIESPVNRSQRPEDVEFEEKGREESRLPAVAALVAPHVEKLARLVTVYSDGDAHDALDRMREWLWGYPLPAEGKERKG